MSVHFANMRKLSMDEFITLLPTHFDNDILKTLGLFLYNRKGNPETIKKAEETEITNQDNSNFYNTNQPRGHTMYITIKRTSYKPNLPSIAATHTQRTSHNSSPSNPFSQSKPDADISSPTNAVSHCNNKNSRY